MSPSRWKNFFPKGTQRLNWCELSFNLAAWARTSSMSRTAKGYAWDTNVVKEFLLIHSATQDISTARFSKCPLLCWHFCSVWARTKHTGCGKSQQLCMNPEEAVENWVFWVVSRSFDDFCWMEILLLSAVTLTHHTSVEWENGFMQMGALSLIAGEVFVLPHESQSWVDRARKIHQRSNSVHR